MNSRTLTIPSLDLDTVEQARDATVAAAESIAGSAADRWDDAVDAVRRATGRSRWYERVPTWGWVAAGVGAATAAVVVVRRRRAAEDEQAATWADDEAPTPLTGTDEHAAVTAAQPSPANGG